MLKPCHVRVSIKSMNTPVHQGLPIFVGGQHPRPWDGPKNLSSSLTMRSVKEIRWPELVRFAGSRVAVTRLPMSESQQPISCSPLEPSLFHSRQNSICIIRQARHFCHPIVRSFDCFSIAMQLFGYNTRSLFSVCHGSTCSFQSCILLP